MEDQILIGIPVTETFQQIRHRRTAVQMGGMHEMDDLAWLLIGRRHSIRGQILQETIDIGGRLRPDSRRFDALFEGWKGRLTFVVSSGVVSLVAFATIWIFIMSSSRVQALMKVADSLAGGK